MTIIIKELLIKITVERNSSYDIDEKKLTDKIEKKLMNKIKAEIRQEMKMKSER
ncbi:MAG: hypothetical protein RR356_08370 [Bacteroidales bacterium]